MASRRKTITVKSALKGSTTVIHHEVPVTHIPDAHRANKTASSSDQYDDSDGPLIASDHSEQDEHFALQTSAYTDVREAKPLDADIYRVTKRKSRHKVRHDIYNLDVKVFDLLSLYAKEGVYPPKEVMLHISRLYQFEHVNEYLADIKVQSSSSHIVADGPKGGKYRLTSSSGRKKYL